MGSNNSKPPPVPVTPWEPLTDSNDGQTVGKIYVYPKDTAKTLYGVNSGGYVVTKSVSTGKWKNTNHGSVGHLAISDKTMYKTDGNDIYFGNTSGNGDWTQGTIGTNLSGMAVLGDKLYTTANGVLSTASTTGSHLTVVPGLGTEKIKEVCVSGGNIYGTDGSFLYALTSPTSGPWIKKINALPTGVTSIKSLCANSSRLFVVGNDGYVYGTC